MVALGGDRRYSSYSFLTMALDGDEWLASRLGRAFPWGKDPWYPLYRTLVGLRASLDTEVGGKILCPSGDRTPVVQSMFVVHSILVTVTATTVTQRTSVSIVSDYRLDDWGSVPDRDKVFFSSLCAQTSLICNGYQR
jgi:hypothetical protein